MSRLGYGCVMQREQLEQGVMEENSGEIGRQGIQIGKEGT